MHNAHFRESFARAHTAMLEILGVMNRPQVDEALLRAAGLRLDGALFHLLVVIGRFGPIGVVELADRAGRDHTTVSRQVAKLESLGLAARRTGTTDRRVREVVLTAAGEAAAARIDRARLRIVSRLTAGWTAEEIDAFAHLLTRFAGALATGPTPKADDP